jgi:murein L,D-transpeptidase YafK
VALKQFALVAFVALSLAACEEDRYRGSARHNIPIPAATYALMSEKGMSKDQPILIRSYKKESELEIWKRKANGQYALLKTYPMCRWSGQLGPKVREGDRMAPEGFYAISPAQMNPNSSYYVSFNMGYPNAFDRAHGRTGSHLMVHGACSSAGCYSMTDDQMGEIYALVREAHNGGQRAVQMQALPFRMTPENLAKHRLDPNIAFWKNLKEGTDYFDVTGDEPQVAVNGGRYVFNGNGDASVVQAVQRKRQQDETQVAALVAKGTPAIKLIYDDGDQHGSFKRTLVANGSDSLNRTASWGSRDVGVSRPDALTSGPRVVVLDDKGRAKTTIRAESADNEVVLAAVAAAATEPAAKPEASRSEPARAEAPRAAPAATATTQLARVQPGTGTQEPVATGSFGTASAESEPFYRRALSFVPVIGTRPAEQNASAPVASVVPTSPTEVVAPLPPRRADRLRTSRVYEPAAAFASQPATR